MRKIALILGCCCIFLASCEKKYLIPEKELPQWLKASIDADMIIIEKDPGSMEALGSWTRTEWRDGYYYQYENGLFSTLPAPISHNNDTLGKDQSILITKYYKEKCCDVLVWEGPRAL